MNCALCSLSVIHSCDFTFVSFGQQALSFHPTWSKAGESWGIPGMTYLCTRIGLQQLSVLPQPGTTVPGRARRARGSAGHTLVARCRLGGTKPSQWTPPKSSNFPGSRGGHARSTFSQSLVFTSAVNGDCIRRLGGYTRCRYLDRLPPVASFSIFPVRRAFLYKGFLSEEECDHLVELVTSFSPAAACNRSPHTPPAVPSRPPPSSPAPPWWIAGVALLSSTRSAPVPACSFTSTRSAKCACMESPFPSPLTPYPLPLAMGDRMQW